MFAYTKIEKVVIPKSLTRCGGGLFESSELKEAVLPDEMTEIPTGLFSDAIKLTKVNVPSNLTTIGNSAFDGTNVDVKSFLQNKNLTTIEAFAFCSVDWSNIVIPANIKEIGYRAFGGLECDWVDTRNRNVVIEGKTDGIDSSAFSADWLGDNTFEFKSGFENSFADLQIEKFKLNKKGTAKKAEIMWIKVKGVGGYDIIVSSNKSFKKNLKMIKAKKNENRRKIKVSKKQKKLYVKIRPYKTINGKKVYGRWTEDYWN